MSERGRMPGRSLLVVGGLCAAALSVVGSACAGAPVGSGAAVAGSDPRPASVPFVDKSKGALGKRDADRVVAKFRAYSAALGSGDMLAACRLMDERPSSFETVLVPDPGTLSGCSKWMANRVSGMKAWASGDIAKACELTVRRATPEDGSQAAADDECRYVLKSEYRRLKRLWPQIADLTGSQAYFVLTEARGGGSGGLWVLLNAVPRRVELYRVSACPTLGASGIAVVPIRYDFPFRAPAAVKARWPVGVRYVKIGRTWEYGGTLRPGVPWPCGY